MFDVLPNLIAGGIMGAGQLFNYNQQREANQTAIEQSDKQIQFQDQMSKTAHQREVADLQAAGLNPILSAGGNGASTPSGSAAPIQAPQINMPDLLAYGMSVRQLEQTDQRLALDKQRTAADIAKNLTEQDLNKMKKILYQKGMIKAELEGEGSQVLRKIIKFLKESATKTPQWKNDPAQDQRDVDRMIDWNDSRREYFKNNNIPFKP